MAANQNVVDMQDALRTHERMKRSSELPLFYGQAGRDSITPMNLIKRFEKAAVAAKWDTDEKKITEFWLTLRDPCLKWWASLEDEPEVDISTWENAKKVFLENYEPRYNARTTCTNLHDLKQRPNESCHDFSIRINETFKRLKESIPDDYFDELRYAPTDAARAAALTAIHADDKKAAKIEGGGDMERFYKHQHFLAGLRPEFRTEVAKAGKKTLYQSLMVAKDLELIMQDKGHRVAVAAIPAPETADERTEDFAPLEALDDDELAAVNAFRRQNGRPPFQRSYRKPFGKPKSGHSNGNSNSNPATGKKCRYCQKMGHLQKECRSRLRDKAPMVDANGQPYKSINAVEEEADGGERTVIVKSLSTNSNNLVAPLNWN
jgi:hypothetical protein